MILLLSEAADKAARLWRPQAGIQQAPTPRFPHTDFWWKPVLVTSSANGLPPELMASSHLPAPCSCEDRAGPGQAAPCSHGITLSVTNSGRGCPGASRNGAQHRLVPGALLLSVPTWVCQEARRPLCGVTPLCSLGWPGGCAESRPRAFRTCAALSCFTTGS